MKITNKDINKLCYVSDRFNRRNKLRSTIYSTNKLNIEILTRFISFNNCYGSMIYVWQSNKSNDFIKRPTTTNYLNVSDVVNRYSPKFLQQHHDKSKVLLQNDVINLLNQLLK